MSGLQRRLSIVRSGEARLRTKPGSLVGELVLRLGVPEPRSSPRGLFAVDWLITALFVLALGL